MNVKTLFIILFLAFNVGAAKTADFSLKIDDINESKVIKDALEFNHFNYLVERTILKELKMNEKEYLELQMKIKFRRLMRKNYSSSILCFGNS